MDSLFFEGYQITDSIRSTPIFSGLFLSYPLIEKLTPFIGLVKSSLVLLTSISVFSKLTKPKFVLEDKFIMFIRLNVSGNKFRYFFRGILMLKSPSEENTHSTHNLKILLDFPTLIFHNLFAQRFSNPKNLELLLWVSIFLSQIPSKFLYS